MICVCFLLLFYDFGGFPSSWFVWFRVFYPWFLCSIIYIYESMVRSLRLRMKKRKGQNQMLSGQCESAKIHQKKKPESPCDSCEAQIDGNLLHVSSAHLMLNEKTFGGIYDETWHKIQYHITYSMMVSLCIFDL